MFGKSKSYITIETAIEYYSKSFTIIQGIIEDLFMLENRITILGQSITITDLQSVECSAIQ